MASFAQTGYGPDIAQLASLPGLIAVHHVLRSVFVGTYTCMYVYVFVYACIQLLSVMLLLCISEKSLINVYVCVYMCVCIHTCQITPAALNSRFSILSRIFPLSLVVTVDYLSLPHSCTSLTHALAGHASQPAGLSVALP